MGTTSIRVRRGTKREPDVIEFQTLEETRTNDVVAALEKMHDSAPVSAKRIGEAVGMGHHQTLIYLHVTRGWEPGNEDASMSLADERATLAADTLACLYEGKPLSGRQVAEEMERPVGTVARWLTHAETKGLVVRTKTHRGSIPLSL